METLLAVNGHQLNDYRLRTFDTENPGKANFRQQLILTLVQLQNTISTRL